MMTKILNKLNACAIFASAGQEMEGIRKVDVPFEQQVYQLVAVAEKLGYEAAQFKEAALQSQEELGAIVEKLGTSVVTLGDAALSAADRAPSPETTQSVINAFKAVAISAKQLALSAKDVQKNPTDKTGQATLDSAIASFPRAVSTFISTVQGSSSNLGQRLDNLRQEMDQYINSVEPVATASANSVVAAARAVAQSAGPLVFSSSQDELLEGAQRGLRCVEDLLAHVKGAAKNFPAVGAELSENSRKVASAMNALLDSVKANQTGKGTVDQVIFASSGLNTGLEQLVGSVNKMPGGKDLKLVSTTDLDATVNKELAAAADLIQSALGSLPKRARSASSAGDNTGFRLEDIINEETLNDAIVSTARSIAEATGSLVMSCRQAQSERSRNPAAKAKYHRDPTWANGLISAAAKTAAGVNRLTISANNCVAGKVDEEQLITDARFVAVCIKQLMVSARTKEDIHPQLQESIQNASREVAKCTSDFVEVAQKAGDFKEQRDTRKRRASTRFGIAGSIVQKLEQQAAILRLEKQLEDARKGLTQLNAADYRRQ